MQAPAAHRQVQAVQQQQQRGLALAQRPPARRAERSGRQQWRARAAPSAQEQQQAANAAATAAREAQAVLDEEDLWQFPDRDKWYLPKFAADDAPDWLPARFVRSQQLAPGVKEVVMEVQISRERVPLRNAYRHVGQRAAVRVNSGENRDVTVACPPFPLAMQQSALLRVRGDIASGEIKKEKEDVTALARLEMLVTEDDDVPDVYNMAEDDTVELGPFAGAGLDLRGPVIGIYNYPTLVLFVEGVRGMAAARALLEAGSDVGGLNLPLRKSVVMYYRASNDASMLYRDRYEAWAKEHGIRVVTATRDTFMDMFDDDDQLVYEPAATAAIILTGGEPEDEAAALEVCKEAEISMLVRQSEQQAPTRHLNTGKEQEVDEDAVE